jgi:hypothetical protein
MRDQPHLAPRILRPVVCNLEKLPWSARPRRGPRLGYAYQLLFYREGRVEIQDCYRHHNQDRQRYLKFDHRFPDLPWLKVLINRRSLATEFELSITSGGKSTLRCMQKLSLCACLLPSSSVFSTRGTKGTARITSTAYRYEDGEERTMFSRRLLPAAPRRFAADLLPGPPHPPVCRRFRGIRTHSLPRRNPQTRRYRETKK